MLTIVIYICSFSFWMNLQNESLRKGLLKNAKMATAQASVKHGQEWAAATATATQLEPSILPGKTSLSFQPIIFIYNQLTNFHDWQIPCHTFDDEVDNWDNVTLWPQLCLLLPTLTHKAWGSALQSIHAHIHPRNPKRNVYSAVQKLLSHTHT